MGVNRKRDGRDQSRLYFAICVCLMLLMGCASHSDHTRAIRSALDVNQPQLALEIVNDRLDVDENADLPTEVEDDTVLFILDRASILQQVGEYALSSRDLEHADKQVEVLDFSGSTLDDIGRYMFSDDSGPYRAPAYEKLMINTLNMLSYLVRGDLSNARVEARRFSVMNDFVSTEDNASRTMAAPGAYLAGFVFEKSGNTDEALRYYDEALELSSHPSLAEPIARLLGRGGYTSPRLQAAAQACTLPEGDGGDAGEVLFVINYGRVPAKIAKRVPIGLALTMAADSISPNDRAQANRLAAQGAVTWVNYPELGPTIRPWTNAAATLDQTTVTLDPAFHVEEETRHAWDDIKGAVIASAVTRMVTRLVAGAATREATRSKKAGADILSTLFSLGTQVAMTAADTPDTRSWATLPARIAFARMRIAPGEHQITLSASGVRRQIKVNVRARGWSVVNLTVLK